MKENKVLEEIEKQIQELNKQKFRLMVEEDKIQAEVIKKLDWIKDATIHIHTTVFFLDASPKYQFRVENGPKLTHNHIEIYPGVRYGSFLGGSSVSLYSNDNTYISSHDHQSIVDFLKHVTFKEYIFDKKSFELMCIANVKSTERE